ncbi:hypothetical protein [Reinekea sp. G2M2-21]|uniref:hypothetical protein n=1 Tax=Reinekea sp. G2M2-21 TaxID=2788942 RepID=UPI0018AA8EB7|nr:hypothetical protein [Reinekea sp. G2M2-21]
MNVVDHVEKANYLINIVQVMIPVLTGVLVIGVKGITEQWDKLDVLDRNIDFGAVCGIALLGVVALGLWAGVMGYGFAFLSENGHVSPFPLPSTDSFSEAFYFARTTVAAAYILTVTTAIVTGIYYLHLHIRVKSLTKPS